MNPAFRFPRSHRLKRRRLIQPLFNRDDEGVFSVVSGSIRIQSRLVAQADTGTQAPLQVGFAVGKSTGGAVIRNRVKRLMREVYRTNQRTLLDRCSTRADVLTMMIVFRGNPEDEKSMRQDLENALNRLAGKIEIASPTQPT